MFQERARQWELNNVKIVSFKPDEYYNKFKAGSRLTENNPDSMEQHRKHVQKLQQRLVCYFQKISVPQRSLEIAWDWDDRFVVGVILNDVALLTPVTISELSSIVESDEPARWTVALSTSIFNPKTKLVENEASMFLRNGVLYVNADDIWLEPHLKAFTGGTKDENGH